MADYAIHDTTLTGIANVIRKKDGTSALIDPADYADRINLMGMLEEKTTTSASIAHIEDGASEVPIKNWLVTLPASLSGYSAIVGTQINSDNLFLLPENDFSVNSVDFKVQNNALIIDGTVSGGSNISSKNQAFKDYFSFGLPAGTYYFTRGTWNKATYVYKLSDDTNALVTNSGSFTLSEYTVIYIGFYISLNTSMDNVTFDGYIKQGSTASSYSPPTQPTQYTASLGRTIYGGTADIVTGEGEDENGNAFTFTPITPTPETENVCNFWADEGDSSVTYRAVDTVQPIPPVPPTLISKNITENGTYSAEDDDADGYDEVTVNVPPYSFMPTWTETKLVDNSGLSSSITFASDYHNYQMLRFVIYNSSTQIYDSIFVLPSGIDKAFTYSSNKFCLNQQITGYTNQYVTYQEDSLLSWSRTGNRNCNVYEVYGMTFTNATMTAEVIYSRDAIASSNVSPTPPTGKTFFDYDAIIYMCCTTDTNITHFCKWWITKPKLSLFTDSVGYGIPLFAYNTGKPVVFTETSIGTYGFFYVVGLNFTAT